MAIPWKEGSTNKTARKNDGIATSGVALLAMTCSFGDASDCTGANTMEHKRLTLFAGHYGSGKTNIAVNYALLLASEGKKVCIADLDIVNP